ncbi:MAG: FGGY-family carbohydrate kinase [bacterium]
MTIKLWRANLICPLTKSLRIGKSKSSIAESVILPHFVGSSTPWIDARSKGAILGLSIHTNKADIIRAILESVVYEQWTSSRNAELILRK